MSEYQYYEFAAIDRPLDGRQLGELRALSTRADITSTLFVNTYHWGSFRRDPRIMMERYFDAFVYVANWGTHELMLRLPARLLDLATAQRYCQDAPISLSSLSGWLSSSGGDGPERCGRVNPRCAAPAGFRVDPATPLSGWARTTRTRGV